MSWSPWSSVSEGRAGPGTSVTAVPIGGNRIAVFAADPGGGVFTNSGSAENGWAGWSSVSEGRAGPGTSVSAVPIAGGRFTLFVADPGGGVFTNSGSAESGWAGWSSVSEGRAGPGTSVSAVPIAGGRFTLFVADPGGGVFTNSGSAESGWAGWSSVSEGRAGPGTSVTAVPIAGGRFTLFVADPGGGVFTNSGSAESGWAGWSSVSEGRAGPGTSVTAVPIAGGRFTLFVADPGGGVFTNSGSAESGWAGWSSVSEGRAGPGTSVTAVPIAGGRFSLFVADPRGGVFTTSGDAEQGWDPWTSVSQGQTGPGTAVTASPIEGDRFVLFVADPAGGVFTASGNSGSPIKHVFVLMLENRSFDHMLGFSGITGTDAETGKRTTIEGLKGDESNSVDVVAAGQVNSTRCTFTVATGATDVMDIGPGHEFDDVLEQLTGQIVKEPFPDGTAYPTPINNFGFVANYAKKVATEFKHLKDSILSAGGPSSNSVIAALEKQEAQFDLGVVMKCFSPSQLPVLTALAREFVVCDHWFSSIPGPTEPNRMFAHAATAGTWDRSPDHSEIVGAQGITGFKFKHGTIYDQLRKAGVKYRIYADDSFPVVGELDGVGERLDFEDFAEDLKENFDAGYVHIEPAYGVLPFTEGNSQHPNYPGGVAAGERFIKATYEAIRNSPIWKDSLLIITWDEHGGFYDHVTPGPAPRTGNRGRRWGFMFDHFGPRVPAVVVSPLIQGNMIEHRTFDHTAIPATLSRVFKLPLLGARNDVIRGLDHLVGNVFRSETPATLPDAATTGALASATTRSLDEMAARNATALISDDPQGSLARVLHSAIVQHLKIASPDQHAAILDRVRLLTTHADAFAYMKEVEQLVREKRG